MSPPPSDPQTVLIIDEHAEMLSLLKEILERAGYQVFTAQNSQAALQYFENENSFFDLFIIDTQVGEMTGSELLDAIELRYHMLHVEIRVIFIAVVRVLSDARVGAFLQKPFSISKFLETVREICGSHRTEASL